MEISTIIPHIEALVFASDKPLTAPEVTEYVNNALGFIEDRANLEQVEFAIEGIKEKGPWKKTILEMKRLESKGIDTSKIKGPGVYYPEGTPPLVRTIDKVRRLFRGS